MLEVAKVVDAPSVSTVVATATKAKIDNFLVISDDATMLNRMTIMLLFIEAKSTMFRPALTERSGFSGRSTKSNHQFSFIVYQLQCYRCMHVHHFG
jgi:hypothetical protein